jgi:hypothetical protein
VDPDLELIDEVTATVANTPDRDAAGDLLGDAASGQDTSSASTCRPAP